MFCPVSFSYFPKLFLVNLPVQVSRGLGRTLNHPTEVIFKLYIVVTMGRKNLF